MITSLGIFAAPGSSAAAHWDTFTTNLPQFITGPTPFTITVDGPTPVCAMSFEGQALTAEPWTFTYPIALAGSSVTVQFCDATQPPARVNVHAMPAFTIWNSMLSASAPPRDANLLRRVGVANNLRVPARVEVRDGSGRLVGSGTLQPGEDRIADSSGHLIGFPVSLRRVKANTFFTVTVTGDNGLQMTRKVLVAKGWAPYPGTKSGRFAPCSTVTWLLSPKGQPRMAKTFLTDVRRAFRYLGRLTGLRFTEVSPSGLSIHEKPSGLPNVNRPPTILDAEKNPVPIDIVLGWEDLTRVGYAGYGSTTGVVHFNSQSFWVGERFKGFRGPHPGSAGRGWLIIHEVMHTLMFDHDNDPRSIMYPRNNGQNRFSRGDLTGLRVLYPKCPAR